jgi:hypothetical protein
MSWLWRAPFLRDGSLLYAAANVTLGAVELLAVLIARDHGSSSAAIGVAFAIIGAGGVASAALARPLRRRLTPRWSVLCEPWFAVAFVPMLLLCRSALTVGGVVAIMFLPMALSSSVVVGQRLTLTPDHLRGRVQASASFISGSIAWVGPLVAGILFQEVGETATVLTLAGWTIAVAGIATLSRGLRQLPRAAGVERRRRLRSSPILLAVMSPRHARTNRNQQDLGERAEPLVSSIRDRGSCVARPAEAAPGTS